MWFYSVKNVSILVMLPTIALLASVCYKLNNELILAKYELSNKEKILETQNKEIEKLRLSTKIYESKKEGIKDKIVSKYKSVVLKSDDCDGFKRALNENISIFFSR